MDADSNAPPTEAEPTTHEKVVFIRRSLALTEEQWKNLEELANVLNTLARGGPNRGSPSWRTMIAQIADDSKQIIERERQREEECVAKAKMRSGVEEHKPQIVRSGDMKA